MLLPPRYLEKIPKRPAPANEDLVDSLTHPFTSTEKPGNAGGDTSSQIDRPGEALTSLHNHPMVCAHNDVTAIESPWP